MSWWLRRGRSACMCCVKVADDWGPEQKTAGATLPLADGITTSLGLVRRLNWIKAQPQPSIVSGDLQPCLHGWQKIIWTSGSIVRNTNISTQTSPGPRSSTTFFHPWEHEIILFCLLCLECVEKMTHVSKWLINLVWWMWSLQFNDSFGENFSFVNGSCSSRNGSFGLIQKSKVTERVHETTCWEYLWVQRLPTLKF